MRPRIGHASREAAVLGGGVRAGWRWAPVATREAASSGSRGRRCRRCVVVAAGTLRTGAAITASVLRNTPPTRSAQVSSTSRWGPFLRNQLLLSPVFGNDELLRDLEGALGPVDLTRGEGAADRHAEDRIEGALAARAVAHMPGDDGGALLRPQRHVAQRDAGSTVGGGRIQGAAVAEGDRLDGDALVLHVDVGDGRAAHARWRAHPRVGRSGADPGREQRRGDGDCGGGDALHSLPLVAVVGDRAWSVVLCAAIWRRPAVGRRSDAAHLVTNGTKHHAMRHGAIAQRCDLTRGSSSPSPGRDSRGNARVALGRVQGGCRPPWLRGSRHAEG